MSPRAARCRVPTALSRGLLGCECCGLVSEAVGGGALRCPRCGFALHARKPDSLQRTTAYLPAAVVLYVPANTLPIMGTSSVVIGQEEHTILGGILELWHTGSWDLALIVFIASIAVPILKIAALALLVDHGAPQVALAPGRAGEPVPPARDRRPLVDARRVRRRAAGRHGALRRLRQRRTGCGPAGLRRRRRADHARLGELRSPSDLARAAADD